MKNDNGFDNEDNGLQNNTDDLFALLDEFSDEKNIDDKSSDYDDNFNNDSTNDNNINDEMNEADDDLLALLDMITSEENDEQSFDDIVTINDSDDLWDDSINNVQEEQGISSIDNLDSSQDLVDEYDQLMNNQDEYNEDTSVDDDNMVMDDLFSNEPMSVDESDVSELGDNSQVQKSQNDVGDMFSDVLSAVGTLDDDNQEFLDLIPDISEKQDKTNKNVEPKDKKEGLFTKIFSKNKKDENIDESISNADKSKKVDKKKNSKKDKKVIEEKNKQTKLDQSNAEEELIKKEEEKKAKKEEEKKVKKAAALQKKKEKQNEKKQKAEMKKATKKEKKAKLIADEVADFEDTGRINKVGLGFVICFSVFFLGFVLIGTNLYSYHISVHNAKFNFERQRYNEAYQEIYGLSLKNKKDTELYQQIRTVMYVYKQYNSYNSNYELERYPEALDSLLKGLEKYDKHIDKAKALGVEQDLNTIKKQLLVELKDKFNVTEKEAIAINNSKDQTKYSVKVIDIVQENIK